MADIQQWRRKIQPTRSRTPAIPFPDLDDADDLSVMTPKKRVKPKLSSYFGHNPKSSMPEGVANAAELPTWPPDQFYPDPKPEELLDQMMCTIMNSPYTALESRHNSSLMLIFENYRELMDEKTQLLQRLETDAASTRALIVKYNMAEKDWQDEKQDYKDEVKRLEVLLAKASKRGIAEVTLARQDSRLHGRQPRGLDRKETIFEFLEKSSLYDDKAWGNQRAMMKPIVPSSVNKDMRASQQLAQKKSMTHLHADLPFGTPPTDTRFSLTNPSMEQGLPKAVARKRATTVSTMQSTSEDTFSSFSFEELAPAEAVTPAAQPDDGDLTSIIQIAEKVASRRNVDPSQVMPQLFAMFNAQGLDTDRSTLAEVRQWPTRSSSTKMPSARSGVRHSTVMSKASGFLHKFVPQLNVGADAGSLPLRRFSFEPGDDLVSDSTNFGYPHHSLRKSVSAHDLREPCLVTSARSPSPLAQSPTPGEGRVGTPTRIPTPIFHSGSLARPRQEREDSAASLLTVIQHEGEHVYAQSVGSSSYSSPSSSRINLARTAQQLLAIQTPIPLTVSNRLSTNAKPLRGANLVAVTAARNSIAGLENRQKSGPKQPSLLLLRGTEPLSATTCARQESTRPGDEV